MSLDEFDFNARNLRLIEETMEILGVADCEEIPDKVRGLLRAVEQRDEAVQGRAAIDKRNYLDCAKCGKPRRLVKSTLVQCLQCGHPRHEVFVGRVQN